MNKLIEMIRQRFSGRKSLRWSMVRRLLFGWFFPLFMLIFIIVFFVSANSHSQIEHTIMTSMEKSVQIMRMQLKDCETASKNASYIPTIAEAYADYLVDGKQNAFGKIVEGFLKQQYAWHDNCRTAELIMLDFPEKKYFALNNSNGGTYRDIEFFYAEAKDRLLEVAQTLDTGTTLVGVEGRVYMVRNLVTSKFKPYAVLVLELDQSSLMESYAGMWGYESSDLYWNGELLMTGQKESEQYLPEHIVNELKVKEELYVRGGRWESVHVYRRMNLYGGTLVAAVTIDKRITHAEMNTLEYLFVILIVFMIPLVVQMMRFFYKKVTLPLRQLITAANAVREGALGTQIINEEDNEEFWQMKDSFNHMSTQLKNQFDKIYLEEIALRDAKIMALQSQINPHFLNNTLEIINWEARLNGNYKVSGMIEALSTMLGETMNRKEEQFHSVAEEIAYADAYLYIISQRFGAKFGCTKQIDERLMNVQVPRLIIQPIVENAVEHGMDITKQGRLEIRLFEREDGYLCIEVEDNGHLTKEDRDKIDRLLSPDVELSKEKRVSLGIRNVDQRLKMIYGSDCGLFIAGNDQEHTVSTILLKIDIPTEQ
ncbi:MAG: sensor histidine kinase [Lachnospiraceae bacterium]|nr:sensor histidine kinase [Lachnospiraceae bacterium]